MKRPGEISIKETPKGHKLSGKRTGLGQTLESNIRCTKEAILIRENLSGKKTETGIIFLRLFFEEVKNGTEDTFI